MPVPSIRRTSIEVRPVRRVHKVFRGARPHSGPRSPTQIANDNSSGWARARRPRRRRADAVMAGATSAGGVTLHPAHQRQAAEAVADRDPRPALLARQCLADALDPALELGHGPVVLLDTQRTAAAALQLALP